MVGRYGAGDGNGEGGSDWVEGDEVEKGDGKEANINNLENTDYSYHNGVAIVKIVMITMVILIMMEMITGNLMLMKIITNFVQK